MYFLKSKKSEQILRLELVRVFRVTRYVLASFPKSTLIF